jgi:Protein of unknown function (DUF3606)
MSRPIPYTSVIIDPMNCPQVEHWAKDLQVETGDLRAAIKLVGPRLSDLRRYFGRSAQIIFLKNRLADTQTRQSTWSAFPPVA